MRIPNGSVDQFIYFVAVDIVDLKTRETGLSTFTVDYSIDGDARAQFTTPTVNEVDATNLPGVYELLLDEGTTFSDSGHDVEEVVYHIEHASMASVTRVIELYRPKITQGETLVVESDGMGHADVKEWLGDAPLALVSQRVQVLVDAMSANVLTAAAIQNDAFIAAKFAADVGSEFADAIWDEDLVVGHAVADSAAVHLKDILEDVTGLNGDVMVGTDSALLAVNVPSNFSAMGIEADGHVHGDLKEWLGVAPLALATQLVQAQAAIALGTDDIDANVLATDAVNEIRDAILNADMTNFQGAGTLGETLGDSAALGTGIHGMLTTNLDASISSRMASFTLPSNFSAMVISGAGVVDSDLQLWLGVAPLALDTQLVQATATLSLGTDDIDANVLSADAAVEIAAAVWARDASLSQGAGSFGETLGDSLATGLSLFDIVAVINSNLDAAVTSRMATFTLPTNFSALSITAGGIVDSDLQLWLGVAPLALASQLVQTDMQAIDGSASAATNLAASADVIRLGTVDNTAFTATSIELESNDIADTGSDKYIGRIIIFRAGAASLDYEATDITDYSVITGRGHFTYSTLSVAPTDNDVFIIV